MLKLNTIRKIIVLLLAVAILMTTVPSAFAVASFNSTYLDEDNVGTQLESVIKYEADRTNFINDALVWSIIQDTSKNVDDLQDAILEKKNYVKGLSTVHEVNYVDFFRAAIKLKYPEMTDFELGKTILLALGDSEEFVETLPEDKVIEALEYTSAVKTESYYKETINGDRIEMSEDAFYTELAEYNSESEKQVSSDITTSATSDVDGAISGAFPPVHDNEEERGNGYLKITSTAFKHNPDYAVTGRNYFIIRGEVEWFEEPWFKLTDILAISSSGNFDNQYLPSANSQWTFVHPINASASLGVNDGNDDFYGSALHIYSPSIYGIAVDVKMVMSYFASDYDLDYVCAYYGITTDEDVTCQVAYAHTTLGLGSPTVGIDQSGVISFSVSIVQSMDDYYGTPFTLYYEDYSVLLESLYNREIHYSDPSPIFAWSLQRGNTENYILEIDYLGTGSYMSIPVNGKKSYTLSSGQWSTIINNSPFTGAEKVIRWRIKINYEIYTNEVYYSAWDTFSITGVPLTSQESLSILSTYRYTEKTINLGAGGYKDFYVTFSTGGTKLIQTFGKKDTIIEMYSADGSLLVSSDDEGYSYNALIRYVVVANTQYKIRIKFYRSSEYGNTKLAITPAYGALNSGVYLLNRYEDIYAFKDTEIVTWSTFAEANHTRVITFTPSSSGSYTFTIDSSFDTYIYVVDPSTSDVVPYTHYDDDDGEGMNPMLTITLTAHVPYLIVYSAYNPSTLTETKNLSVLIRKD